MDPITMVPETALGTPGSGDETLLGILQRLRDLSQQPLVPQNPLAQLGTVFQGFSSGVAGQPNPALQFYARQREEQRRGLGEEAQVGGTLATLQTRKAQQDMERNRQVLDVLKALPDTSPETRTYKFQALQQHAKSLGVELPSGLVAGLITGQVTPQKLEEAAKLVIRGYTQSPQGGLAGAATVSDMDIATALDMPVNLVSQQRAAFLANPNGYLASIGHKTFTQLASEEADLLRKNQQALEETKAPELTRNMAARPFVLIAAQKLFPGKQYMDLALRDREKAMNAGLEAYALQDAERMGQRAYEVALQKLSAAENAPQKNYVSANYPYAPLSSSTTDRTAKALEAVKQSAHVPDKNDLQALKYIGQMKPALDEYRDAVSSLPEYFPPMTGDRLSDLAKLAAAGASFHMGAARTDPRTVPLTAIKRHVVNLARLSGTGARISNYVAELERASGGFDTVAGQDVKLGLANQVETFINSQLDAMGLNGLPKYVPGRIARLSTGKVVRILPDGTQYVIGGE